MEREEVSSMYPYPPIYPEPFDCRRPGGAQRHSCGCDWDLTPANVSAQVLGMDSSGAIILRIQRQSPCRPEKPCDRPPPPGCCCR